MAVISQKIKDVKFNIAKLIENSPENQNELFMSESKKSFKMDQIYKIPATVCDTNTNISYSDR